MTGDASCNARATPQMEDGCGDHHTFTGACELAAWAEDWNSPEDAVYDDA